MEKSRVDQIFEKFKKANIMVVGDAIVDSYISGPVERISPEAPVPVIHVNKQEYRLGGAANVSLNLQSLGASQVLVSLIGCDTSGDIFLELLKREGLTDEGIIRAEGRITTKKTRVISCGQHVVRMDEEQEEYIQTREEDFLYERVEALVSRSKFDVIIFADYDKGVITPGLITRICRLAKSIGIKIAVDPKFRNFSCYKNVDLFKPNFNEFLSGINGRINKTNIDGIINAAQRLKVENKIDTVFITLSELGGVVSNGSVQEYFPAAIRAVSDVSGAGDTVIAVASMCLAVNLPVDLMAQLSNFAGSLVCEKAGVVPVDYVRFKTESLRFFRKTTGFGQLKFIKSSYYNYANVKWDDEIVS